MDSSFVDHSFAFYAGDGEVRSCNDSPILAKYLGDAITCDAYHFTNPRPDDFCVLSCIQNCLADANVSVEEVTKFEKCFKMVIWFC